VCDTYYLISMLAPCTEFAERTVGCLFAALYPPKEFEQCGGLNVTLLRAAFTPLRSYGLPAMAFKVAAGPPGYNRLGPETSYARSETCMKPELVAERPPPRTQPLALHPASHSRTLHTCNLGGSVGGVAKCNQLVARYRSLKNQYSPANSRIE